MMNKNMKRLTVTAVAVGVLTVTAVATPVTTFASNLIPQLTAAQAEDGTKTVSTPDMSGYTKTDLGYGSVAYENESDQLTILTAVSAMNPSEIAAFNKNLDEANFRDLQQAYETEIGAGTTLTMIDVAGTKGLEINAGGGIRNITVQFVVGTNLHSVQICGDDADPDKMTSDFKEFIGKL